MNTNGMLSIKTRITDMCLHMKSKAITQIRIQVYDKTFYQKVCFIQIQNTCKNM